MSRTRARVALALLGAVGSSLVMAGQAQALGGLGGIGFNTSLPFDETCANNGTLHLPPVTNADLDLGREVLRPCHNW